MEEELITLWKPWMDVLNTEIILSHIDKTKIGYTRHLEPYFREISCVINNRVCRLKQINKCESHLYFESQYCFVNLESPFIQILKYLEHPEEQE